jgi:hypothetical protein
MGTLLSSPVPQKIMALKKALNLYTFVSFVWEVRSQRIKHYKLKKDYYGPTEFVVERY